jgi:hypothetical protein
MASQILLSEEQQQMLASGKEDNLIDENLSYKMMLMMSKMNETTAASQPGQYQHSDELIINDHSLLKLKQQQQQHAELGFGHGQRNYAMQHSPSPADSVHVAACTPTQSVTACAACPMFESHYWR